MAQRPIGPKYDAAADAAEASRSASARPLPTSVLRWRCRRGMRELDVLLERYLQERYPSAAAAEQEAFEALLDLPDPELFALLMRRQRPAVAEWAHVIARLTDTDN